MTYAGNPSISAEVQSRIRNTFEQTLDLAARGNRQEASLGCDFILQLDPQFQPAQSLRERLEAGDGPVEVDDLRPSPVGRPSDQEQKAEADALFGDTKPGTGEGDGGGLFDPMEDLDLDDLEDELPELPEAEAAAPSAADTGQRERWQRLLEERRFDELLTEAETAGSRLQTDPELARLASDAAERKEAASFVERFVERARQAARDGDEEEARGLLAKARSLDPTHPALAEAGTESGAAPAPPAGAPPATPSPASPADGGGAPDLSEPDLPEEPAPFDALADAGGSGDEEGDRRIAELLDEGQAAFVREDYQGAIDAWSRIFLIDIDHGEASRRIEEARRLKSEQERKIEEVFHDANRALEEGDTETAEARLRRVLELAPGHMAAREQLDRLEAGEAPPPPPPTAAPTAAAGEPERPEPLREEILVPPEPGAEPASAVETAAAGKARTMTAKGSGAPSRRFLLLGSAVLALVLVVGYLLYQNRDSFFPNAAETPAGDPASVDPIARANRLHEEGRTAMAVNQLRRVPPTSPRYEEAQALISQWEAEDQPVAPPPSRGVGVDPAAAGSTAVEEAQRRLLERAEEAVAAGEFLRARSLLQEAEATAPLPDGIAALRGQVEAGVKPVEEYVDLMAMGEYTRALPELWRLYQDDPDNPDVRHLIADSYYSLALRALQQGDAATAVDHLEEAAGMEPDNDALDRHLAFARTYAERDKDLLYRIYVKYLPPR